MAWLLLMNLTGKLVGCALVPTEAEDLAIDAAVSAALLPRGCRLEAMLSDGSAGTFSAGPLTGAWEWLENGELIPTRDGAWVGHLLSELRREGSSPVSANVVPD